MELDYGCCWKIDWGRACYKFILGCGSGYSDSMTTLDSLWMHLYSWMDSVKGLFLTL